MKKVISLLAVAFLIFGSLVVSAESGPMRSVEDIGMLSTDQASREKGKEIIFSVVRWGEKHLYISASYVRPNLEIYWGEDASQVDRKLTKWYGDRKILVVYATALKTSYFSPSNFVFTQGTEQYGINPEKDVIKMTETFEGKHLLRPEVRARGLIAIPESVDTKRDYKLWYGNNFGIPKQWEYHNPVEN